MTLSDHRRDAGFAEAYEGLAAVAHRVGFRIVGRRAEAEEIAQEAMARAYAHWPRVRGHADAWVARVAANLAVDVHRRLERDRRKAPDLAGARSTEAAAAAALDRLELVALLRALPRRQREVLVLRYVADLPEQETADAMGCSVGTVKQHAHRALDALRRSLAERASIPDPLCEPGGR